MGRLSQAWIEYAVWIVKHYIASTRFDAMLGETGVCVLQMEKVGGAAGAMRARSGSIDCPIVRRDRIPTQNALRTVEQRREFAAGHGALQPPDTGVNGDRRIAHNVEAPIDPDDPIDIPIDAGEERRLAAEADGRRPLISDMDRQALASAGLELPGLFANNACSRAGPDGAFHAMDRGRQVNPERSRRVRGIVRYAANDHLAGDIGGRLFHRNGENGHPLGARARGLAVGPGDAEAIDEYETQIGILGRPRRSDRRLPTRRQCFCQRRVRHPEVQSQASFRASLDQGLGGGMGSEDPDRRTAQKRQPSNRDPSLSVHSISPRGTVPGGQSE